MQAAVKTDVMVRTVTADVHGVEDIDVTSRHHRRPRIFRPDHIRLELVDGGLNSVEISGWSVLSSGATSGSVRKSKTWWRGDVHRHPDTMPEWAKTFVLEAPKGVTTWRTGADAGEVQAL